MDPITIFVASIVGAMIVDAVESPGEFDEFYRRDIEKYWGWISMEGRNVIWWVKPGSAVWIKAKYLRPISGNIFDSDKLGAVARAVRDSDEPVHFYAPYGQLSIIGPDEVSESIAYAEYDVGRPYTTGDAELDAWLVDPDLYLEKAGYDDEDRPKVEAEMAELLAAAVENQEGDLGQWTASVRDGNHRAFGSVLGGEEYVAIRLYDADETNLQEALSGRGRLRRVHEPLLHKLIEDTGELADWMRHRAFRPEGSPLWAYEDLLLEER